MSEDVSSTEFVQQAEVLAAEANRTLAQARSAEATAKRNRSGFFFLSDAPASREGKDKGKLKRRRIHRVSSVAEVIISGDGVLNDHRKEVTKDRKMELARVLWPQLGVLVPNCLRHWCFKLMLFWTLVRRRQLVSKQCRSWLMPDRGFFFCPWSLEQGSFKLPWVGSAFTLWMQRRCQFLQECMCLKNEEISSGRSEGFGSMI